MLETSDFNALAAAIAAELGGTVTRESESGWNAATLSTDTFPVHISETRRNGNGSRLVVSVEWPSYRDERGNSQRLTANQVLSHTERQDAHTFEITCSLTKSAAVIAGDIRRRILAPNSAAYQVAVQRCRDNEENGNKRMTCARALAKDFGLRESQHTTGELYGMGLMPSRIHVQHAGETLRFEAFTLPVEVARRVLTLLQRAEA